MSVVGFDIGNINSVIAVARNRGVDVICNEVSNRATPTLVSFSQETRYLGEAAKTQEVGNYRNTVFGVKRLLGLTPSDSPALEGEGRFLSNHPVLSPLPEGEGQYDDFNGQEKDGEVLFNVDYKAVDEADGEDTCSSRTSFTATQLMAMLVGRLKSTVEHEIHGRLAEVVLAVPAFFTDRQRRTLCDAADIAGLKVTRLINEGTAAVLAWALPRASELPPTTTSPDPASPSSDAKSSSHSATTNSPPSPVILAIVDLGHSATQVTVSAVSRGRIEVRGCAWDACLGGRDFDDLLAQHVANELATKQGLDVRSNRKAMFRLRGACERTKKVLSANSVTRLAVEALQDDRDISLEVTRDSFESLVAQSGLLERLKSVVEEACEQANLPAPSHLDALEIVGGSTRIPAVKALLTSLLNPEGTSTDTCKQVSTTLNQDEAVARGAALLGAILSPQFKVREAVQVQDIVPAGMPAAFSWAFFSPSSPFPATTDESEGVKVFPAGNAVPSTKLLTIHVPVSDGGAPPVVLVKAHYSSSGVSSSGSRASSNEKISAGLRQIGVARISASAPVTVPLTLKVKVRINPNSCLSVESVTATASTSTSSPNNNPSSSDGASSAEAEQQPVSSPPTTSPPVFSVEWKPVGALSADCLDRLRSLEAQMALRDRIIAETADKRNALEEFIYAVRGRLESRSASSKATTPAFVSEGEAQVILERLASTEAWLYDEQSEGDGSLSLATRKASYTQRLADLQALARPLLEREREWEERPKAESRLRFFIGEVLEALSNQPGSSSDFAEADQSSRQELHALLTNKLAWMDSKVQAQAALPAHQTPAFTAKEVDAVLEEVRNAVGKVKMQAAKVKQQRLAAEEAARKAAAASAASKSAQQPSSGGCCPGHDNHHHAHSNFNEHSQSPHGHQCCHSDEQHCSSHSASQTDAPQHPTAAAAMDLD